MGKELAKKWWKVWYGSGLDESSKQELMSDLETNNVSMSELIVEMAEIRDSIFK